MKNIRFIVRLFSFLLLFACSNEDVDSLTGKYKLDRYDFESADNEQTEKLGQGLKAIHLLLSVGDDTEMTLVFGSREWYIPEGTYTAATDVLGNKQYTAVFKNGVTVQEGDLDVTLVDGIYHFSGILETTDAQVFKVTFRGAIHFIEGQDDSEPSGYTIDLSTSDVSVMDWNTGQVTYYPDLTKYSLSVSDPTGKQVALFDAINKAGLEFDDLIGTYTLQGNPTEVWLMDQGWSMPEYYIAGGTYFTDERGTLQYATSGKISLSSVPVADGSMLYSIRGDQLTVRTFEGSESKGDCSYVFLTRLR